ncbi:Annexin [Fasciola hepatica]|uniref:Annexin n=1 Tax=Fasciola hepatica TaxID=6192 RepID=A0A4E0RZC0_FASHE|nr:Annexin [Fasciola hepatica]
MPLTGGISAPVITPLKQCEDGLSKASIDTGTYIELKSDTPNAKIFFTTDGSNPNPWRKKVNGREKTFTYKAPFALQPGRRIVKAMAVHSVTQVESHIVTKQFMVSNLHDEDADNELKYDGDSTDSEINYERDDMQRRAIIRQHDSQLMDESVDQFLRRNADQGFAATNHSGTQINLWGQVPGLNWDVRTPNSANICGSYFNPVTVVPPIYQPTIPNHMENGVTHQQLTMIATQLSQCIDQTRHMTVAEVRELLKQMTDKLSISNKPEALQTSRPLLAISQGGGDLPGQLDHICKHLMEYARCDPQLSAVVSNARMGKVLSADFDEDDSSFLLTVQIEKPETFRRHPKVQSAKTPSPKPIQSELQDRFKEQEQRQPVSRPATGSSQKSHAEEEKKTERKETFPPLNESKAPVTEGKRSESMDDNDPAWATVEDIDQNTYPPNVGSAYPAAIGSGFGVDQGGSYNPAGFNNPYGNLNTYNPGFGQDPRSSGGQHSGYPQFSNPPDPSGWPQHGSASGNLGVADTGYLPGAPSCSNMPAFRESGMPHIQADLDRKSGYIEPGQPKGQLGYGGYGGCDQWDPIRGAGGGCNAIKPHEDIFAPTLRPFPNFNPSEDCERLRKAMKGLGTDEKAIIDIMGHRSFDQRTKIVLQFKTMYGKDLIKEFKSELSGHFYECVEALCYSPEDFDAIQLRKAVKGAGTDEDALIEILCSRTNEQIRKVKEAYTRLHGRDLEKDVVSDTSRYFKRIMVSLIQANRDESTTVDRAAARRDAEELYSAGEKKLGTDESKFIMILGSKSFAHLRAVFEEYGNVSKNDIEKALKSEMSGDLLKSMLSIVRCIKNKPKYFAYQLYKSMKGLGTRDRTLIRIIVSRCEIDLAKIKEVYAQDYGKTLESWVSSDTTGDYKRLLLALISG